MQNIINVFFKQLLPEGVVAGLMELAPLEFCPSWLKAWASVDLGSKCRSAVQII